jgi:nicotinamide-nucleotide amidase
MIDSITHLMTRLKELGLKSTAAESCTGGMIAAAITDYAGSSSIFERGFVTYSNQSKHELLGVNNDLFKTVGAVSAEVAEEMASGALKNSHAHIAVSCTGIAGPGGATDEKPIGLVYIGVAYKNEVQSHKHVFSGDRHSVRTQTVDQAARHMIELLDLNS